MIEITGLSKVLYTDKKATTVGQAVENAVVDEANLRYADLRYVLEEQIGGIRAYKLVNHNYEGPYQGGITYEIGKTYQVKNANTDDTIQCAEGINLATLGWCITEWRKGYHILIAEFTQKDIAAIPIVSNGKLRVHKCKIVGEKDLKKLKLK